MALAATHYGVHGVSGQVLLDAIDAATAHGISGASLFLVPVNDGKEIAVIGAH